MARADAAADKPGKPGGSMGLVVKVSFGLGLVAVAVLFLAAIDFGLLDLRQVLAMPAVGAFALFLLSAGLGGFASMKTGGAQADATRNEVQERCAEMVSRMAAVEAKFSGYLGEETARIKKDNEQMRAALDKIKQDEENRMKREYEELKQRNLELQAQLQKTSGVMQPAAQSGIEAPSPSLEDEAA